MLFRAVIKDQQILKEFLNIVITLSKLTKETVLIISKNKIDFIVNEESCSSAPLVWTEIHSELYFDQYSMEGIDEEHNMIVISFNPLNLARALTIIRHNIIKHCKIKLTNKDIPCLTIDIEIPSVNSINSRRILHDIPIQLIQRREWSSFKIPNIPKLNICLKLASAKYIKNLIDKIKNISPSITIYGTNEGELNIVAETDQATVCARYRNLEIELTNRDDMNDVFNDDGYFEASCLVSSKKTSIFLSALQITNTELSCGIVQERLIHMEVTNGTGSVIHCIIPAVCL